VLLGLLRLHAAVRTFPFRQATKPVEVGIDLVDLRPGNAEQIHALGDDRLRLVFVCAMGPRHREDACHPVSLGHRFSLREAQVGGIAAKRRNQLAECLRAANTVGRTRAEKTTYREQDLLQRREIALVRKVEATTD
jgi:hypothetical protein